MLQKKGPWTKCKSYMTLEFLLSGQGFIEWEFSNKDIYSKYYFYTRKRTLFNQDMFDPLKISY